MPTSIVFRNNDTFPLNATEIDDNFEFIASQSYVTELAFQGLANDVNAAIAALNNGSTFTTVGINDTATSSMRLAVEADSVRFTADTADFELLLRRTTATDDVRIAFGEASVERFTFGLEGGDNFVVTASTDGISIFTALTIYGATGYANVATRLGIGGGASPSFGLHLKGGAFGGTLPAANNDAIVQENDGAITNYFLTPDANAANLYFGCASTNDYARLQGFYNSNNPYLRILISGTERVRFQQYGMRLVQSYTVATLPSASTAGAGTLIYVSDGTSNKRLAVSDATNWRWPDGAVVS